MEVLFALSKEALKIISTFNALLILTISDATSARSSEDSITQGPAINIGFIK
jgi:hypothetical protein